MQHIENEIPNKRYFKIGEVSSLTNIEPYVLRFWESEFPKISPIRSRSGQRLYRKCDIEMILKIKSLLYSKRYTILGAKQYLQRNHPAPSTQENHIAILRQIKDELLQIREMLTD